MANPSAWRTALTDTSEGKIRIRGVPIERLIADATFPQAVFLLLRGAMPTEAETRMMEAILVSSIDHGLTPPSVLAARTVLSGGNSLNAAVAAGVLTIGDAHGGAIEQCARILQEADPASGDPARTARQVVKREREAGRRMPGYGHRVHREDPRTVALFRVAREAGFGGPYLKLALEIEKALEEAAGRRLCLNVDGAIAAVTSEMGFDWRLGKGFFIISRTPGLVAHVHEEWTREARMRRLSPPEPRYDGPGSGGKGRDQGA
jgi:citryl-CoA lyase